MKITLYELLGLVKDGKAPKKIKFNSEIWMFNKDFNQYQTNNGSGNIWNGYNFNILNDTVEILEEQKKIPEKLPDIRFENGKFYLSINGKQMYILREVDKVFLDKINEIIDYLKSKGEK